MRKSIDSRSMLVGPMFDQSALSGDVFVFYGRGGTYSGRMMAG